MICWHVLFEYTALKWSVRERSARLTATYVGHMWVVLEVVTSSLKINKNLIELAWQLLHNDLAIPFFTKSMTNSFEKHRDKVNRTVLCWGCCQTESSYWGCLEGLWRGKWLRNWSFSQTLQNKLEEALSSCSVWSLPSTCFLTLKLRRSLSEKCSDRGRRPTVINSQTRQGQEALSS